MKTNEKTLILIGTKGWSSYDVYLTQKGNYHVYYLGSDGVGVPADAKGTQPTLVKSFRKYDSVLCFLEDNADKIFEGNFQIGFKQLEFRA